MIPVTDGLLGRMVRAIVDEVDPEQVILFGSRARGDERKSSDVDLLVVEAEPFGPDRSRHRELVRIHHVLAGFRVPADVIVYMKDVIGYDLAAFFDRNRSVLQGEMDAILKALLAPETK